MGSGLDDLLGGLGSSSTQVPIFSQPQPVIHSTPPLFVAYEDSNINIGFATKKDGVAGDYLVRAFFQNKSQFHLSQINMQVAV